MTTRSLEITSVPRKAQKAVGPRQIYLWSCQIAVPEQMINFTVIFQPDKSAFEEIDYVDTWRGMVEAKTLGLTRSIGLANFNITQVKRLLELSHVKPSVLDVEVGLLQSSSFHHHSQ